MKTEQLRELDAWIGIHLFDMHEFQPAPSDKNVCAECSHRVGFEMHFVPDWASISDQLPHYTTDPAASMMVLEKCQDHEDVDRVLMTKRTGFHSVWAELIDGKSTDPNSQCWAATLPLAICLFAEQLFNKP